MRYREFKLTEQQLEELKMSPSALGAFAKSPVAQGIKAGFEAEMVFPGLGGRDDDDYEMEPDYDMDERAHSIDDIIQFFEYDDYGYGLSDRQSRDLRSRLEESYWEYADEQLHYEFRDQGEALIRDYIEENEWDWDERTLEYLTSELNLSDEEAEQVMTAGKEATSTKNTPDAYLEARAAVDEELNARAEESYNEQDGIYDTVLEQFREDYAYPEESEFLQNRGIRYMSDVENEFDLSWPYMTVLNSGPEGGFDEYNAEQLADDLSSKLGVSTKASSGYHSAKRDETTWIFEPDSSLDADDSEDMPVEIVSPPMELGECLKKLDEFFAWADTHNAYTNKSTGFHMGVSLPNVGGKVDFVKLALFLGDEHVLQAFGRQAVGYCEAAMKKIKQRMKGREESVESAMTLMREGLIDAARKLIASDEGFGKYTSINPKGNYIEFRSAGGEDYSKDIPKLKNTLLRYAQAMVVAADPQLERKEYYKKFYKLISPAGGNTALDLFARFASGTISKEELKQQWANAAIEKESPSKNTKWAIIDRATGKTLEIVDAPRIGDVNDMAIEKYHTQGIDYDVVPAPTAEPKASRRLDLAKRIIKPTPGLDFTMSHYIMDPRTGKVVHTFNADDNRHAVVYLRQWKDEHPGSENFLYGLVSNLEASKKITAPAQQQSEPRHNQQIRSPNGVPMWEIYVRNSGETVTQFADHNQNLAWQTAQQWLRDQQVPEQNWSAYSVRPQMPQV